MHILWYDIDMENIDVVWAAGLLEGEGSFMTATGKSSPVVSCHMTDLDVLEELQRIFGGRINPTKKQKEHHKDAWRWAIYGDAAAHVMRSVRPYMKARRTQKIDLCLEVWDTRVTLYKGFTDNAVSAGVAYNNGEGSLRALGKRFNVSYESVRRASQKFGREENK